VLITIPQTKFCADVEYNGMAYAESAKFKVNCFLSDRQILSILFNQKKRTKETKNQEKKMNKNLVK